MTDRHLSNGRVGAGGGKSTAGGRGLEEGKGEGLTLGVSAAPGPLVCRQGGAKCSILGT